MEPLIIKNHQLFIVRMLLVFTNNYFVEYHNRSDNKLALSKELNGLVGSGYGIFLRLCLYFPGRAFRDIENKHGGSSLCYSPEIEAYNAAMLKEVGRLVLDLAQGAI
jgi:hypothetical protein